MNLLFVLPGLYLNILKTEEILQFWNLKFLTCVEHVIPTQKVKKLEIDSVLEQMDRFHANVSSFILLQVSPSSIKDSIHGSITARPGRCLACRVSITLKETAWPTRWGNWFSTSLERHVYFPWIVARIFTRDFLIPSSCSDVCPCRL